MLLPVSIYLSATIIVLYPNLFISTQHKFLSRLAQFGLFIFHISRLSDLVIFN